MSRRLALVLSLAVIVAAIVPWGDFQGHTHWKNVGWIPFVSPPVRLTDIVANVLLFWPFGAAVALNVRRTRAVATALIIGLVLSFCGESMQLYSHGRFPSATDVVTNGFGAWLGAWMITRAQRRRDPAADSRDSVRRSA